MPTLRNIMSRIRIPLPLSGTSETTPVTTADKVLVTGSDAVTAGNTVDDHIASLIASVADATSTGGLTEQQVNALINTTVARVVTTSWWRGQYAANVEYHPNDYAQFGANVYRRLNTGTDGSGNPTTHTQSWVQVSSLERLIAFRLRDIETLVTSALDIPAVPANRGRWPSRNRADDSYSFSLPPMQWRGPWNSATAFYYGDVVTHDDRPWVLNATANIVTAKQGDGTDPGNDAAWVQLPTGHGADFPHYRGEWNTLVGQTILVGDTMSWLGDVYYCTMEHASSASIGPDDDSHFLLLNNFHPGGWTDRFYHQGTTLNHAGQTWFASGQIVRGDPEPGAANNTKWRQISGFALPSDVTDLGTALRSEITAGDLHSIRSEDFTQVFVRTQAQFDALTSLTPNSLYLIRAS